MKAVVLPDVSAKERKRSGDLRYRVPPKGCNDEPVVVRDEPRDLTLVRIRRDVRRQKGVFYMGSELITVVDVYLDGTYERAAYTADRKTHFIEERKVMSAESTVRAARTKDTIDFGRFQQACVALMTQIDRAKAVRGGPDLDPVQEEAIFRGYQGLLQWQEELNRQVLAVEASIDVVAAKIRDAVQ